MNTELHVFRNTEERQRAAGAFDRCLARLEAEEDRKRDAAMEEVKTPADVRRWQRRVRRNLHRLLGPFPERTPLRARTVGHLERGPVRIEKLVFESRPKLYVTANLYIPLDRALPAPAVLVPCGHAKQGKACRTYRETGMGLARMGYVALVYDPTGQGERSECYDPRTRRHWVAREVPQHHWTGKPCFLTGGTLAGFRAWDGIRCIDLLCAREEVDATRIGVMGNSGGGAMTMLITACDPRVKACAAGHPGGSMENTHLYGRRPPDRLLYSLIAPRPCRIIVGDASGEEAGHRRKLDILRPFYEVMGCPERAELVLVDGKHDLEKPKREAGYEWFNCWLRNGEGSTSEPSLRATSEKVLYCTGTGQVQASLGGETMFSLNRTRARHTSAGRSAPEDASELRAQLHSFRRKLRDRIRFIGCDAPLDSKTVQTDSTPGGRIERLLFESEPGMAIPCLLFEPAIPAAGTPVVIHVSETGKPKTLEVRAIPIDLWRAGIAVLSIDVRDTGELSIGPIDNSDIWPPRTRNWRNFNGSRWEHDSLAIRALGVGRSRSGMRVLDVIRAVDLLKHRRLSGRGGIAVVGEGRGGIWALKAAALDPRIGAVIATRMLASYRMLTDNPEYNQFDHFWVPGALLDYDVCQLPALCAPRPVWIVDPIDQMSRPVTVRKAKAVFQYARDVYARMGCGDRLHLRRVHNARAVAAFVRKIVRCLSR